MSRMSVKVTVQDKHVKQETNHFLSVSWLGANNKQINISLHFTSLAEEGLVEWYEPGCVWPRNQSDF